MSLFFGAIFFIKNILKSFMLFASTKLGQFIILICCSVFSMIYCYKMGFKNGVSFTQTEMAVHYQKELDTKLEEQKILQKKASDDAIDFILKNNQREIIYQDKIRNVEKIIKEAPQVSNVECGLTSKQFDEYVKTIKAIK